MHLPQFEYVRPDRVGPAAPFAVMATANALIVIAALVVRRVP